ncbi:hypothetical protein L6259_03845 [Candidatus Parcubacteria bacterium]|nr:hypothetical protein [Patescibacteria group bacterium]MCG2694369.1 hypothetical protein [Candidatus Parcubacteria bacterium]
MDGWRQIRHPAIAASVVVAILSLEKDRLGLIADGDIMPHHPGELAGATETEASLIMRVKPCSAH